MSRLNSRGARRVLLALGALAVVSLTFASPALAGRGHYGPPRGYRGGHYWVPPFPLPPLPRVVVGVPFPPVVVVPGPPVPYPAYGYYGGRGEYERGYEDGWRDRDRDGYYRAGPYRRGCGCDD
jgi:hypothetical protein